MSSHGSRPAGTDGSDHWHRESVAWQYKISSLNKSRLSRTVVFQIFLGILLIIRLLPGFTALVGLPLYQKLRHWDIPAPKAWEYAWVVSVVAAVFGLKSLAKNNSLLLKQFVIGTVTFGILPVIYGLVDQFDDILAYYNDRKYTARILGYPAVLVWYFFLALAIQIHIFELYFSVNLLKAWKPRDKKLK